MRSSSICSAASRARKAGRLAPLAPLITGAGIIVAMAALACCLACSAGGGARGSVPAMVDLINPALGPDYTAWLIGPIARIASADEIKTYLALHDDGAAAAFIQQFWERRGPAHGFGSSPQASFEERREVADRKFSEAGVVGHRTDRGTVLVLYGPPQKTGFEVAPSPNQPAIEVWQYGAKAALGLDGRHPDPLYRFSKRGDLTVFYTPRPGMQHGVPALTPP